ncbi:MAG: glutathione S-transferase N-terminal domain-containing protein [Aquisalimonadaceae bacterium]
MNQLQGHVQGTMFTSTLDPRVVERSREEQVKIDEKAAQLALYYYESCSNCIRVLRTIERLRLKIDQRNIRTVPGFRKQLIHGGGRASVPCLRVRKPDGELEWIYGPNAIIEHLEKRFC